jgi:hypothetical protein
MPPELDAYAPLPITAFSLLVWPQRALPDGADGRFVTSAYQAYGDRMWQLAQATVDAWSAPDSDSGQTGKR